ncbi:hypothetical protein CSKR_105000 [Clonorchis sinensis]|uniref:Uncharacterized protein n=1 Tax=Clonorchis sinensis TaxID=79923 RepID=A0A419PF68_CLOSI|nr:hypothetical protein CSKR_105000 [Clonorchis sinensis]
MRVHVLTADLFCRDFRVIAPPIRITRLALEGITTTHSMEQTFRSPFPGVRILALHFSGQRKNCALVNAMQGETGELSLRAERTPRGAGWVARKSV